jgi:hypothetical protein
MKKSMSLALGAFALAAMPVAAFADNHMEADNTPAESDLESAAKTVGGQGEDLGYSAFSPKSHGDVGDDQIGTIDLKFPPFVRYEDAGDLKDDAGDVQTTRFGGALSLDYFDSDKNMWSFRYGYEYSDYDIGSTPVGSVAEDALDSATVYSLTFLHMRTIDEQWTAFGGFGYQWAGTDGVSFSDGRNFRGGGGALYQHDEDLTYGLGLVISDDFDDDAFIVPVPIVTWHIDENSRLRVRGTRADYEYDLEHDLTAHAILAYEFRAYRLEDEVEGTLAEDGVVNDTHVLLGVGLDWKPRDADWLTVSGEIGAILGQKFEIEKKSVSTLDTVRMDDSAGFFAGLSVEMNF